MLKSSMSAVIAISVGFALAVLSRSALAQQGAMPTAGDVNSMTVTAAQLDDTANFLEAAQAQGQGCNGGAIQWPPGSGQIRYVRGAASSTVAAWRNADLIWSSAFRWMSNLPAAAGQQCGGDVGNEPVNWGGYATICPDPVSATASAMRGDAASMRKMVSSFACHLNGDLAAEKKALQDQEDAKKALLLQQQKAAEEAKKKAAEDAQKKAQQEAQQKAQQQAQQQAHANAAQTQTSSGRPLPPTRGEIAFAQAEKRAEVTQQQQAAQQNYANSFVATTAPLAGVHYSGQRGLQIQMVFAPQGEFLWVGKPGGNGSSTTLAVSVPYWFNECKRDQFCSGFDVRVGGHFGMGYVNSNPDGQMPMLLTGDLRGTFWLDRFGLIVDGQVADPIVQYNGGSRSNLFEQFGPGLVWDLAGAAGESQQFINLYGIWKPLLNGGSKGSIEGGFEIAAGAFFINLGGQTSPANTTGNSNGQPVPGSKKNAMGFKEGFIQVGFTFAM